MVGFFVKGQKISEKLGKLKTPTIIALHDDNYHDGDEINCFGFRDEMGKITQELIIGAVYWVTYNPALETASDKKISKACGTLEEVGGQFGLRWATIYYEDGSTAQGDMILGFMNGMALTKINA
jgi:hypothetical protein